MECLVHKHEISGSIAPVKKPLHCEMGSGVSPQSWDSVVEWGQKATITLLSYFVYIITTAFT